MLVKWIAAVEDADGYSMPQRHFATQVVNVKEDGDSFHLVINETDNLMLTNPDGGKYRVRYRFGVTVDDDVERRFFESDDTVCIKQPK